MIRILRVLPRRLPAVDRAVRVVFGLVGILVGVFTIIVGVGPQTTADIIVIHVKRAD